MLGFPALEKQRELEGGDELPEPEEVRQAREELKSLEAEKEKTEKLKNNVTKELENAKERAARIEGVSTCGIYRCCVAFVFFLFHQA